MRAVRSANISGARKLKGKAMKSTTFSPMGKKSLNSSGTSAYRWFPERTLTGSERRTS